MNIEYITNAVQDCTEPNWDGYGAQAVRQESIEFAASVLSRLPVALRPDSIGVDPDGSVSADWHRRDMIISASFDEGEITYAVTSDAGSICGVFNVHENRGLNEWLPEFRIRLALHVGGLHVLGDPALGEAFPPPARVAAAS